MKKANTRISDTDPAGRPQPQPHHRLTTEDVARDYKDGLITATGYLYYLIKSSRRDGWRYRIDNVREFCRQHGLSKSAFYRAIKQLESRGLQWEALGRIDLWIGAEVVPISGQASQNWNTQSQNWDTETQIWDGASQDWDADPTQTQANQAVEQFTKQSTDLFTDQQQPVPTQPNPVSANQERIGRILAQIAELTRPNKTIRAAVEEAIASYGNSTERRIELALEAVREQQQGKQIKNIGGLVVQAIRKGYTPNNDRRRPQPDPPDIAQVEAACVLAARNGDQAFIEARLASLPPAEAEAVRERLAPPVDLSDTIASIEVERRRLGWEDGSLAEFLQEKYGKRSRQRLTDSELVDLLETLRGASK